MNRRNIIRSLMLAAVATSLGLVAGPAMAREPKSDKAPQGGQVRMALITATVIRRSGRRGIMSVESTLEIEDGALMDHARLSMPRLNAAFNEAIQTEAARTLPNTVPDLNAITRALQVAVDRVLGRAGAKVLLGTVMMT